MLAAIVLQRHVGRVVQEGVLDLPVNALPLYHISEVFHLLLVIANIFLRSLLRTVVLFPRRGCGTVRILARALLSHSLFVDMGYPNNCDRTCVSKDGIDKSGLSDMASFFDRIQYTEEAHSTESESESAVDLFSHPSDANKWISFHLEGGREYQVNVKAHETYDS